MIVVPAEGQAWVATVMAARAMALHLFTNDVQPGPWDSVRTYEEPTGYAPVRLTAKDWTIEAATAQQQHTMLVGHQKTIDVAEQAKLRGYYITTADGRTLVAAERFAVPYVFGDGGGTITIRPKLDITAIRA